MASKYKFIVTVASVDREVFPVNFDKLELRNDTEQGQIFKRTKLSGALIFENIQKEGITDFDYFYAQEQADQCATIYFRIEKNCNDGWNIIWEGRFSTGGGKFDLNRCMFEILPEVVDKYTCIMDYMDTELNVLSGNTIYSAKTALGTVEFFNYHKRSEDDGFGFVVVFEHCTGAGCPDCSCVNLNEFCRYDYHVNEYRIPDGTIVRDEYSVMRREVFTTACTGGTCNADCTDPAVGVWNLLSCDCADVDPTCTWWRCNNFDIELDRLRRLDEIIQQFLTASGCSLTMSSIFFNKNPDVADPFYINKTSGGTLNYITGAATMTANLMIEQKTDAKYPNATQPANIGMWTLGDILDTLRKMFKVYWKIDAFGNFKLEHIDYWDAQVSSIDLTDTSPQYDSFKKKEAYEHNKSEIPESETFYWMDDLVGRNQQDFKGLPIIYRADCVNRGQVQETRVQNVTTDIGMIGNYTNDIADDGFVMIACFKQGSDYYVNSEAGILSSTQLVNGHLAWANLHENYHRYDRYLSEGNMNGIDTVFYSWKQNIKQTQMELSVCCTEFNAEEKFETVLGNDWLTSTYGYVETASYNLKKETLKLTLSYSI